MPGIHTPTPGDILTQIEEPLLTDEGRAEARGEDSFAGQFRSSDALDPESWSLL